MSALMWMAWANEWELTEKVSFNGFTKTITVNSGVTSIDIAADVYSAWVRWTSRERQFSAAMRYSGYDPIPNGRTGATFFVINGWKLVYDPNIVAVAGVLYSADYDTAFWNTEGLPLYPATVSSLVNSAVTTQNVITGTALTEEQTANAVWAKLLLSGLPANETITSILAEVQAIDAPTANQIRDAVWAKLLASGSTADNTLSTMPSSVWSHEQ